MDSRGSKDTKVTMISPRSASVSSSRTDTTATTSTAPALASHTVNDKHSDAESKEDNKTIIIDTTTTEPKTSDTTYQPQSPWQRTLLLVSLFMGIFLVALDRTIISTAIPQITDDFSSLQDVGWYGSSYLLTCCAFQLLFGKFYTFYSVKTVLLSSVLLFEVSSVICGAAPTSTSFIVGRAIAGVGASGIFAGCIVTFVYVIPLSQRPKFQGLFGALFGLASIIGPLLGGAFTTKVTWRWCFYINLPFGALAMLAIFFFLHIPDRETTNLHWTKKLAQLDFLGTLCFIPGIVCLLLVLQWGGQTYTVSYRVHFILLHGGELILSKWSDARIIALLTVMSILLIGFVLVQIFMPNTATIPPRIFKQRSVIAGFWCILTVGAAMYIFVFFLPVWFQSIKDVSAINSGVHLLPLMLSMVLATIISGICIGKLGYYTPFAIAGACVMAIGAGLLTTLNPESSEAKWISYQVLFGFGLGLLFQAPNLAAQTVLPTKDVPMGVSLMMFAQTLGPTIFVSVGQNVLDNQLGFRLSGLKGFSKELITAGGATSLIGDLPVAERTMARLGYNEALRVVFIIGCVLSCLAVLGAAGLEWKSTLKDKKGVKKEGDLEVKDEEKV